MRKKIAVLLALAFVCTNSFAFNEIRNKQQYSEVSATQANTNTSFADPVIDVLICNDGSNEVFVDLYDGVAATTDIKILAGEKLAFSNVRTNNIGLICSTGETTTVRLIVLENDH